MSTQSSHIILLVEDNIDDVDLTRESFRRTRRNIEIRHVDDGDKALQFLRKQGSYADAPTPDIVLLDLNMPNMDGREVLMEIAKDDQLKRLPIIILSTSSSAADLLTCYQLGCRSYLVKPVDFNHFQELVNQLCLYWFDTTRLPPAI